MADEHSQMSLVPYSSDSREVVLRHGNAVVLYDPQSCELTVSDAETQDQTGEPSECPVCHRSWNERTTSGSRGRGRSHGEAVGSQPGLAPPEASFVDRDYFGMLAASQKNSPASSATATPRHLFRPALRSGRSREVSGSGGPRDDAEFVTSEPAPGAREGISKSAFSPGYFKQFFVEKGELGRGGNGVVLLVEHKLGGTSLGQFACKRIPVGDDRRWLEKVLVEVKLLQGIPHRNLVPCHWVWLEDYQPSTFGPSIPCLWMLQQYCNGGDLHRYVVGPKENRTEAEKMKQRMRRKSRGEVDQADELRGPSKLPFEDIFSFFRDITSGLHHLHTKGYIHRDLKPSNCLIHWEGTRKRVLISDFGEVQAADAKRGSTGATGTISYCAPEVLRRESSNNLFGEFTTKSDIFSLGMTVYFLCFGRLPYSNADDVDEENEDLDELRAEITQWKGFEDGVRLRPDLPEKLYRFLRRLLSLNAEDRPSTEDILTGIKGGVTLGEPLFAGLDDATPRVATAESPFRSPSVTGRTPGTISRPGLSSLGRNQSSDLVRSRSPRKQDSASAELSRSRPQSPTEPTLTVQRTRKPSIAKLSQDAIRLPPQSPRLMLPPPEETWSRLIINCIQSPITIAGVRIVFFAAKVISLFGPCNPYAPNAWLLYPLLLLAAIDLGILPFTFRRMFVLAGLHATLATLAWQHGRSCEVNTVIWEQLRSMDSGGEGSLLSGRSRHRSS